MAHLPRGPLNSTQPDGSMVVGGVYNVVAPAPEDQQPCALQLDDEGNLLVNIVAGGTIIATNPSVGPTGAIAPTSATEIGIIVGGDLEGVSAANPMPVTVENFPATQPISGTVAISNFPASEIVVGPAASGTPASGDPVQIGSVFGGVSSEFTVGEVVALQCDPFGSVYVDATGNLYTYRGCESAFTPLADPAIPFFVVQGSATKTVKIRHFKITWACTTGNAAPNVIRLRRYTVISGGTPNNVTPVPLDVNNPTATAVVSQYSVLPAATPYNTGSISSEYMQWTTNSATLVGPVSVQLDFGVDNCQALVLRGTSDFIGIEVAAVAAAGPLMTIRVSWTEE